jgi:hypothetical protein
MALFFQAPMNLAYNLPQANPIEYAITLKLNGFIPLLDMDAKAQANVSIAVQGLAPDTAGNAQAAYDLRDFQVSFNDSKLPLTIEDAKKFFSKTTFSLSPLGKVLKTDAPDTKLPIQLPGLDLKRFPEATFVGIEFPPGGVVAGKSWSCKKVFGNSEVDETLTAVTVNPDHIELAIKMTQTLDSLEDPSNQIPADPKDAVSKVHTVMQGDGKAVFDPVAGVLESSVVDADSVSTVTSIATKVVTHRKLHTKLEVELSPRHDTGTPPPAVDVPKPTKPQQLRALLGFYWRLALQQAQPYMKAVRAFVAQEIAQIEQMIASAENRGA